ncbi:MAG: hypothetical protein ACRD2U_14995 [Terriglobales bacterium]
MAEDPKWELAILATVQGFYEKLLQESVGGEVPIPAGLEAISLQQSDGSVTETLSAMRRWLRLLDMAITPAMLRRAFTPDTDPEIAEAMLRYFTRKKDLSDVNREKTDLIATFLYRRPRVPGQWERTGYGLDGSLPLAPFEIALIEILADTDVPSLSEEHVQLLRRFDPLQKQVEQYRDLYALLDSGTLPMVRQIKQSFDSSFYHPGVLATIAPYNVVFGRRFDELFMAASSEIKEFAEALQQQGGSILGNVDGVDVTVEDVGSLKEPELLSLDYGQALQKFWRVSQLKKVLERRPPLRRLPPMVRNPVKVHNPPPQRPEPRAIQKPTIDVEAMRAALTPQQIAAEEAKILQVEESIRVFVRVADPKFRQIVPMRFFNLALSPSEADAYCADYLEEKSLRAAMARAQLRLAAVTARITTELEEMKRAGNSPSLWKLHVDCLIALLEVSRATCENADRVLVPANQQGLPEGIGGLKTSMKRLADSARLAIATLTGSREKADSTQEKSAAASFSN